MLGGSPDVLVIELDVALDTAILPECYFLDGGRPVAFWARDVDDEHSRSRASSFLNPAPFTGHSRFTSTVSWYAMAYQ